jgi:GDP-mannose 4,6-dehydratase
MKKRALITGITGMVGSHLADFLLENTDIEIYGMCRWRSPMDNLNHLVDRINKHDRIHLLHGDLGDYISVHDVLRKSKPDYIFHLAAQSYLQTSHETPLDTIETNLRGTTRLLEAVRKIPEIKPVIQLSSTAEIYGKTTREDGLIDESCALAPNSPYAISKAAVDMLGNYYATAHKLCTVTARLFPNTGPRRGDIFAESTFAKQIALIEKGLISPVVKVGNLEARRSFCDVRDAVKALYLMVSHNPIAGEHYNIGKNFSCSIGEILDFLTSISPMKNRIKIEVDPIRLRAIEGELQIPDTRKIFTHTSWKAEITFEKTMEDLLNYWRERVAKGEKFLVR